MPRTLSADAQAGTFIGGHYRVVRRLGSGGMGTVYEAVNTRTGRRVAIKVLAAEYADRPDVISRFKREARAATAIAHPNIVDVLDMAVDASVGGMFIVQELLLGEDLRTRLDRVVRLGLLDALDALVPVMGALVAAHRRGVIHRDIKPENIFLARGPSGEVPKVIDFGIAKLVDSDGEAAGTHATREGTTLGTVQYMSPEQVRGAADIDARTDVWALGAVLYECLAGVGPFDAPSYNESVARVLTERPVRLEKLAPRVPRALADVVHRALEPERDARTGSMRALLAAVLECDLGDPAAAAQLAARHKDSIPGDADDGEARAQDAMVRDDAGTVLDAPGAANDSDPTTERSAPTPAPLAPARPRWLARVAVASVVLLAAGYAVARVARTPPARAAAPVVRAAPTRAPTPPAAATAPDPPTAPDASRPAIAAPPGTAAVLRPHTVPAGVHAVGARPRVDPLTHLPILRRHD